MTVTITRYGNRYDVSTGDDRLHILNAKSLVYHLKKVLMMSHKEVHQVCEALNTDNTVTIQRVAC